MDSRDKDAIQTDVNEHEEEERPLSAREQMMEQMGARREQELLGAVEPAEEEPEVKKEVPADNLVKVVLDGEEKELPLSEVVKGFQKDSVASRRLEEAAQRQKELDEKEANLLALEEQLKLQTAVEEEEEGDDLTSAIENLIENADAEQTALAIRKEVERALKKATPTASQSEIDKAVETKLAEEEAKREKERIDSEHKTANESFAKNYPEVVADPDLLAAANRRYYAKVNEGKSISQAMDEAGKETLDWLNGQRGTRRDTLRERKQQITSLPMTGARSVSQQDEDNKPQSKSDIIAEMRRQRGLTV